MLVLRPEQLVLSGHGVYRHMLKGGTYYSSMDCNDEEFNRCTVDFVWIYAFVWNKPSH